MQEDLYPFLHKILRQACDLVHAEGGSIFLHRDGALRLFATTGACIPEREDPVYQVGEGITGAVFEKEKSIWVSPEYQSDGVEKDWRTKYDFIEHGSAATRSFLGVPIFANEKPIGVIRCTNKEDSVGFNTPDAFALEVFASAAGAAIEAKEELILATTAPNMFVLMPFAEEFRDVYELGIRDVAKRLKMRCERVDEIEFNDSILAQIYKSIQSADIVVAEMSGRNPNVFYEVGYAHALGRDVILITQDAADIPFDLKHHNHIVYGGKITALRERLLKRLQSWQADQSKSKS